MAKILGKLQSFSFGGVDVPIQSHTLDESYNVIDVTDTDSTGDTVETLVSRATRTLQVEGVLRTAAGVAQVGAAMNFNFDGTDYKLIDASFEETFEEIDSTDSGTSGDGTDFEVSYAARKSTLSMFIADTTAEIVRKVAETATLTFATGHTAAGDFRPESINYGNEVKNMAKVDVSGSWQGTVTQTLLGLTGGTSGAVVLIYKDGGTTDKKFEGTAVITAKSLSANVNGEVRVSYTLKFQGAITPTQYTA
jgi:predicted secreted protein